MATTNLEILISARDQFTGTANRVIGSLNRMDGAAGRVGKGVGQVAGGLLRLGAVAGTAAVGGFIAATKAGADFDAQLRIINTIAQTNEQGLADIGDGLRKLARTGGADLSDLTSGYYDLLSAGIQVKDAQGILNDAWRLGRGALGTTAEGVDVLTTAINSYQTSALYAGRSTQELSRLFSDQFAQAVADGKLKLTDIAGSFADTAALAAQARLGVDQIAAAYGFLTAKGVPVNEVTTQFNRAIIELLKPGADLAALMDKTKTNYSELAAKIGLVPALQQLRSDAEKAGVPFELLFGRLEGLKFALATTGDNYADFRTEQDRVRASTGALDKQVSARNKGLAYQFGILKANILDAALTISAGFLPAVERTVGKLSKALDTPEVRASLTQLGKDIGAAIDSIDWGAVLAGARTLADLMKAVLDVVTKIPPEVAASVVGLTTINKLSGGLLGAGAGNIIGGLGGAAVRGVASKLPGIGAVFAQPVFVTNWPMGGFGGGVGGAAGGAAGGLGLAGAVAAAAPAVAYMVTSALADKFNNDPARSQYGITGTMQPIASPFDLPAVINNFGTAVELFNTTVGVLNSPASAIPDHFQIPEEELRKQTEAAAAASQKAHDDSERGIAIEDRTYDAIEALRAQGPPKVDVKVVVNVTPRQVTSATTTQTRYGPTGGSYTGSGIQNI